MDRQFWICQKSMNHEPLVLIGKFTKLSTSKDGEQISVQNRIDEGRVGLARWRSAVGLPEVLFWHPQLFNWPRRPTISMKWFEFRNYTTAFSAISGPPRAVAVFPHPFQYTFLKHTHDLMVHDTTSLYPRTCTSLPRSTLYAHNTYSLFLISQACRSPHIHPLRAVSTDGVSYLWCYLSAWQW